MKRHSIGIRMLLAAGAAAVAIPASATYVFNVIDYPGSTFTDVRGVNDSGQITGYTSTDGVHNFSFLYSGGVFTPLPASALEPSALGMNDTGTIVGTTNTTPKQGFIFSGGAYTFFSRPGWSNTEARGVNNSGLVTGWSYETDSTGAVTASEGFIFNPFTASFTAIPVAGSSFVIAQGINTAGQVVGNARFSPGGSRGWLRDPGTGTLSQFQIAGGSTDARGINDVGIIAGFVFTATGAQGWVGTSLGYELLDVPGAADTFAEAVNHAGQVSGLWLDASDVSHGFIATPAVMPTGTSAGGAYTFSVAVVPDTPIFIDPKVATGYDYAIGKHDPRVAKVQFPIGIGDSMYLLKVGGRKFSVAGGEWFDFRAHGFPNGVTDFRVGCIEVSAGLDPANAQAFPTGLSFVAVGTFTGTQKPLKQDANAKSPKRCDQAIDD